MAKSSNKAIIPAVPRGTPKELVPFLKALRENAQIQAGKGRGDPLDRAITFRDFQKANGGKGLNVADLVRRANEQDGVFFGDDVPSKPTGVKFYPTFNTIMCEWDRVINTKWYAYTEIFRVGVYVDDTDPSAPVPYLLDKSGNRYTPTFSDAVAVAATISPLYTDYLPPKTGVVYWIRHVNRDGVAGPVHSVSGGFVQTMATPAEVIAEYSKEIYDSENYQWLRSELGIMGAINRAYEGAVPEGSGLFGMLARSSSLDDLLAEQAIANALSKQTERWEVKAQFSKNYARLSGGVHAAVGLTESYVNRIQTLESKFVPNGEVEQSIDAAINQYDLALTSPTGAIATTIQSYTVSYNGNDVSLDTLASVVANNKGEYEAQWGVKTDVNGLQGGVGFYNDGTKTSFLVDANVFAVTGGTGTTSVAPFIVANGKVLMQEALIDSAAIYNLIAANVTAEKVAASVSLTSPAINGGSITGTTFQGANGRFAVDGNGYMSATGAVLNSVKIVNAAGETVLDSSGIPRKFIPDFSAGVVAGVSTTVDAAFISQLFSTEIFAGRIYAENIEGDVFDSQLYSSSIPVPSSTDAYATLFSITVAPAVFPRTLVVWGVSYSYFGDPFLADSPAVHSYLALGSSVSNTVTTYASGVGGIPSAPMLIDIPASDSPQIVEFKAKQSNTGFAGVNLASSALASLFKKGGSLS